MSFVSANRRRKRRTSSSALNEVVELSTSPRRARSVYGDVHGDGEVKAPELCDSRSPLQNEAETRPVSGTAGLFFLLFITSWLDHLRTRLLSSPLSVCCTTYTRTRRCTLGRCFVPNDLGPLGRLYKSVELITRLGRRERNDLRKKEKKAVRWRAVRGHAVNRARKPSDAQRERVSEKRTTINTAYGNGRTSSTRHRVFIGKSGA